MSFTEKLLKARVSLNMAPSSFFLRLIVRPPASESTRRQIVLRWPRSPTEVRSIRILGVSLVWLVAAVTTVVVSLPAPRAVAAVSNEDKAKAREHYQRGLTHYDLKEYADALAEFKNA